MNTVLRAREPLLCHNPTSAAGRCTDRGKIDLILARSWIQLRGLLRSPRPVVDAARFLKMAILQSSLDNLVPKQRKNPSPHEQWTRIPIPVHTRGATSIIDRLVRLGRKLTQLLESQC